MSLASQLVDGENKAADVTSGIIGAIVDDAVLDKDVMQEFVETLVNERDGCKDLYLASKEVL